MVSTSPQDTIYTYHPRDAEAAPAIGHLEPHLPYSLPLLRRLQFHLQTPHAVLLSSFPLDEPTPPCFTLAYVDRTRHPETELWLFQSSELPDTTCKACPGCKSALLAIFAKVHAIGVPEGTRAQMIVGCVHPAPFAALESLGLIDADFANGGFKASYRKYLFDVASLPAVPELPAGMGWHTMERDDEFELVRSHSVIKRPIESLRVWPGTAVVTRREEGGGEEPVAWAFLAPDASLATLRVDPAFRRRGLARGITLKLFKDAQAPAFGEGWAHADVAHANEESNALCAGLGGKPMWDVWWAMADLSQFDRS